jgi:hypothetical protein
MASNLLDLVSRAITPDAVQGIARFLGEGEAAVQGGIDALLPALLGGMAAKASTPAGASSLYSLVSGANVDSGPADNIGSLLGSGPSSGLLQQGSGLVAGLFGADKISSVSSALAGMTELKSSSATNLLLVVAPIVVSAVKRCIGVNRLDAGGLASLLGGQGGFLEGKLDSRLTSALGLGSAAGLLSGLGETPAGAVRGAATAVAVDGGRCCGRKYVGLAALGSPG